VSTNAEHGDARFTQKCQYVEVIKRNDTITQWNRSEIKRMLDEDAEVYRRIYNEDPFDEQTKQTIIDETEDIIDKSMFGLVKTSLVREVVSNVLMAHNYDDFCRLTARIGIPVLDCHLIDTGERGGHDNANLQENAETSHKRKADEISKQQYLNMIPQRLSSLHMDGDIHIHDLEYFGSRPFCADWDLRYFFYAGLAPDGKGSKASVAGPAKRAEVAILHAVKVLGSAQTNWAGGQGYYNFLTFLAPYVEGMAYDEIEHLMQMFVYEMTQMMVARGGQIVFSSVQLSPGVPKIWKDKPCVYKGKIWNGVQAPKRTYGEFEREVRLLFKALMQVMIGGDYRGKPFYFPKPEISVEPQFMEEDKEFDRHNKDLPTYKDLYLMSFELASKFGTPYFDNQLPEYRGAGEGISCYQCCAFSFAKTAGNDSQFDKKLLFDGGKHFSMGSWGVVTINCPRAAYMANGNVDKLINHLRIMMDDAVEVFVEKKRWMDILLKARRIPFGQQTPPDPNTGEPLPTAIDFNGLVYTIGVIGINEVVQIMTGKQLHESDDARRLAIRILTEMEFYTRELREKTGMEIVLARTPAETTGQRFAVLDLKSKQYGELAKQCVRGDIPKAMAMLAEGKTDAPVYYTNGAHVNPAAVIPTGRKAQIEHVFFPIVDGGNIFHIWLGENRPDPRGLMDMAMNICKNTQIGYFAFTRDMTMHLNEYRVYDPETD